LHEEKPAGSVKRRAGELGPGAVGRAAKGQLAARENTGDGQWAVLQRNREGKQEEEDEDLFVIFLKVQEVHCKVKFPSKP
jgi:hypothetical protein